MIRKQIEEHKEKAQALRQEYAELSAQLEKKRAEILGLQAGLGKYNDKPQLLEQMKGVIK